jgi:hypothetical protein
MKTLQQLCRQAEELAGVTGNRKEGEYVDR